MKKNVIQIDSPIEMVGFIKSNGTACRFVSILTETIVTNIRKGCPYEGVIKISKKCGLVNVDYVESVKRKFAASLDEPVKNIDYTAGEIWYKHLTTIDGKSLPIVVNKKTPDNGEFYLQYFPTSAKSVYQMPNGEPVSEENLKPYFFKSNKVGYKPVVISVNVKNIKRLSASGVIMQTDDLPEALSALAAE